MRKSYVSRAAKVYLISM